MEREALELCVRSLRNKNDRKITENNRGEHKEKP